MRKAAAVLAATLSIAVVWSEVTFFNEKPVLSLFAAFVNSAKVKYDYFTIEVKGVHFYFILKLSSSISQEEPFFRCSQHW